MKKILCLALWLSSVSLTTYASDFAVVAGARVNGGSAATAGTSVTGKTAFQAGVLGFFDITEALKFRSGFLYAQRQYKLTAGTVEANGNFAYFDIPATLMYAFNEYGGAFAGINLGLKASQECTPSSCAKDPKSMITPLVFGASFKFAPQMGAEFYYEMNSGDLQENAIKDANAVVVNFLYTFD